MNTIIILDIETIPTQRKNMREYIAANITHPNNIKKTKTIAAWNENEKPTAVEETMSKTNLNNTFNQIMYIKIDLINNNNPTTIYNLDKQALLTKLNATITDTLDASNAFSTTIVGHNVSAFDLRFLTQQYIVNNIRPHPVIDKTTQAKPWETEKVYDTMVQFAGVGNRISLDKLCLALGLPGKGDITGADVWPMVQAGKLKELADYCADDVRKTRAVFKRMTFAA